MRGRGDACAWTRASLWGAVQRVAQAAEGRVVAELGKSHTELAPEPVACKSRGGPTPFHLEPGRETPWRRRYWRFDRWENRYVRPSIAVWSSGSSSGS